MSFIEAVKACFGKYVDSSGRAQRSEFWWFMLAAYCLAFLAGLVGAIILGPTLTLGLSGFIAVFLIAISTFTANVRRLHDTGRSGWYFLVPMLGFVLGIAFGVFFGPTLGQVATIFSGLIMLIGVLLPFWRYIRPSQLGTNTYGPNPHEVPQ